MDPTHTAETNEMQHERPDADTRRGRLLSTSGQPADCNNQTKGLDGGESERTNRRPRQSVASDCCREESGDNQRPSDGRSRSAGYLVAPSAVKGSASHRSAGQSVRSSATRNSIETAPIDGRDKRSSSRLFCDSNPPGDLATQRPESAASEIKRPCAVAPIEAIAAERCATALFLSDCSARVRPRGEREQGEEAEGDCACEQDSDCLIVANLDETTVTKLNDVCFCECLANQTDSGQVETSVVGSSIKNCEQRGSRRCVRRNRFLRLDQLGIDGLIRGFVKTSRQGLKSTSKHFLRLNHLTNGARDDNKLLKANCDKRCDELQCDPIIRPAAERRDPRAADECASGGLESCRNRLSCGNNEQTRDEYENITGGQSSARQDQAEDAVDSFAIMSSQQQRERQSRFGSSRYTEDRRSTYCSSIGAQTTTDFNCDSSVSSSINCLGSQHHCPNMDYNALRQPKQLNSCPLELNEATGEQVGGKKRQQKSVANNNRSAGGRDPPPKTPNSVFNNQQQQQQCQITINEKKLVERSPASLNSGDDGDGSEHNFSQALANPQKEPLKKRENWDKNIEFLLAVIGFAVDLGNVWRFPYICYKNGGGAFLIPYTIMFILGGLPIFYLEMSLGQYFSSGCLTVWRRVCPMAKGIGYAMCVLNFFTGLYYNTIISWAVFFFVESFHYQLPWTTCDNRWNGPECKTIAQRQLLNSTTTATANNQTQYSTPTQDYFEREVLQSHLSHGIDDLGLIRKPLAIYLALVFICIYFAIWKGVKSTGKAVWITALLPYFVLIPLLIRGVFLEGAWLGIRYYLYPDWAKIIDVDVWVEAAKQIYFSLGPGFGTLMALSSYNKFNHNCRRDALIAAAVNYFASFISGLVIFAVLGYMATIEKVSVEQVATEGPGLVFQVYPEGLATMQFSSMWSVLFFAMVITLGIDSTFGGLESVITGLCDEYPRVLRAHRGIFIGLLIILIYLCSLPTTTYGGNYVICLLESYGTSLSLLFIVLVETIIVCWLYGADKFCLNLEEMYGEKPGAYWRICWKYISPTILLLIFTAACGQELDKYQTLSFNNYTYPSWAPTIGLLMTGSSVCCVPIYAIYYLKTKTSGSFLERLRTAIKPIESDRQRESKVVGRSQEVMTDKIRSYNEERLDTDI